MFSKPRYANEDGSMIDLDMEHPSLGVIPFTASKDDVEEHGKNVYAAAVGGLFGPVTPFQKPVGE